MIFNFIISLIIGLVIAAIVVGSMKSKLKTVHMKQGASDYTKANSMSVSDSRDIFLNKRVDRTPINRNNAPPQNRNVSAPQIKR